MKKRMIGTISLVSLLGIYWLVRGPLFELHGMKAWPFYLMILGGIVIAVSGLLLGRKVLPVFTAAGYAVGFALGYFFQFDYGQDHNSLWIIWTGVFLASILAGVAAEIFGMKRK